MMNFIETAQYSVSPTGDPPPQPWRLCRHPNNDIYFYHPEFRLLTPDDVRESDILHYIMEARCDILRCLARDENLGVLPIDYELVIYNVSESAAEIQMYSRSAGTAYKWEENGFTMKSKVYFWTLLAGYPSHHPDLPPNTEAEFSEALINAREAVADGSIFPFSEVQIDQIIARYNQLISQRSQGWNTTKHLAWLMGAVMPLDAVGRRIDDQRLATMMNGIHT